jgi:hypothetical protein
VGGALGCNWTGLACEQVLPPATPLPSGYIGYWKFEDNLADSSGSGNDGSCTSCPTYAIGQVGKAASFDGSSDIITVPSSGSNLDITGNELTISAWINSNSATTSQFIAGIGANSTYQNQYSMRINSGTHTRFYVETSSGLGNMATSPGDLPSPGTWVHVTSVYDGSEMRTYYDGTLIGSPNTKSGDVVSNGMDFSIGASLPGDMYFNGMIDEVLVYDRALSQNEIQQIINIQSQCQQNLDCDDADPCTINTCIGVGQPGADAQGCSVSNTPAGGSCDDSNMCTNNDVCDGSGGCSGTSMTCSDSFSCTDDSCNPASGCIFTPDNSKCGPGEMCDANQGCIPDPCAGITQCSDYTDQTSCNTVANGCVAGFCSWNTGTGQCEVGGWVAPIGIPYPGFGIAETVDMYVGQQYNFLDGRGLVDYPISPVSGKPYTHYVDNSAGNCISCTPMNVVNNRSYDCGTNYGSPTQPLCHIPGWWLPEGTVVEIHGGPYSWAAVNNVVNTNAYGTKARPVFVRGADNNNKIVIPNTFYHLDRSNYLVVENMDFDTSVVEIHTIQNLSLRHSEVHGWRSVGGGNGITIADTHASGAVEDIVIYDNKIYDNWATYADGSPRDYHGIGIVDYAERIWVVDNEIYDNSGDGLQANACSGRVCETYYGITAPIPKYLYIGRNDMHNNCENAVDLKDSWHVIVSENKMYDHIPNCGDSDGTALPGANEGADHVWILFNEIYNSSTGIRLDQNYIPAEVYIIGNNIHDLYPIINNNGVPIGGAISTYFNHSVYVYNNVFYNVPTGFWAMFQIATKYSTYEIINNIFSDISDSTGTGVDPLYISIDTQLPGSATSNSIVEDNIFFNNQGTEDIKWGLGVSYNTIADFTANEGKCTTCLDIDPQFENAGAGDFHLKAGSPAIDNGRVVAAYDYFQSLYGIDIKKDIEGRTRPRDGDSSGTAEWDMGAYEYL